MTQVIRAAFDLGSSHHKMTVAAVDVHDSTNVTILHSATIRVPLADALTQSNDNVLPPLVLAKSRSALQNLRALAKQYGATEFAAIATQVFRVASNGYRFLKHLSSTTAIPITILTSEDEGALAYATVAVMNATPQQVGAHASADGQPVVWDSGGGSTQFCMCANGTFIVHALPLGSGGVRAHFTAMLQCRSTDVHTAVRRLAYWINARAHTVIDFHLARAMQSTNVVTIGGPTCMFALVAARLQRTAFTSRDVTALVRTLADQCADRRRVGGGYGVVDGDREVDTVLESELPKLVLLLTLMRVYGIKDVQYVRANGSCVGLLACAETRFWSPVVLQQQHHDSVRPSDADALLLDPGLVS